MNYTFGVSTWLWTSPFDNETVKLFPKIKKFGYDFVEIPVEDPVLIDVRRIKSALDDNGLKATVCGAFGPTRDLTDEDEKIHQNCFDYIKDCLDICVEVGAGFFGGPMYSAVGKARMVPPEQKKKEWAMAVENLYHVCEMAAQRNLDIGLEPLNRFESDLVNTCEDIDRMIKEINHPAAKISLDGFHMNIEEKDIEAAIRLAGKKLIHIQVAENYRGTPGTGTINWQSFKNGLKAIEYKGGVSIESFTPEVKELAGAVCIWKPLVSSQDEFARDGLVFLKNLLEES
mgnify:CR=1 FL=1